MVVGQEAINRYLWDVENLPATPPIRVATGRTLKVVADSTPGRFGGMKLIPEIIEVDASGRGRLLQSLKSILSKIHTSREQENINKEYTVEDLLTILLKELKVREKMQQEKNLIRCNWSSSQICWGTSNEKLAIDEWRKFPRE